MTVNKDDAILALRLGVIKLENLPDESKSDPDVVKAAIMEDPDCIKDVSPDLLPVMEPIAEHARNMKKLSAEYTETLNDIQSDYLEKIKQIEIMAKTRIDFIYNRYENNITSKDSALDIMQAAYLGSVNAQLDETKKAIENVKLWERQQKEAAKQGMIDSVIAHSVVASAARKMQLETSVQNMLNACKKYGMWDQMQGLYQDALNESISVDSKFDPLAKDTKQILQGRIKTLNLISAIEEKASLNASLSTALKTAEEYNQKLSVAKSEPEKKSLVKSFIAALTTIKALYQERKERRLYLKWGLLSNEEDWLSKNYNLYVGNENKQKKIMERLGSISKEMENIQRQIDNISIKRSVTKEQLEKEPVTVIADAADIQKSVNDRGSHWRFENGKMIEIQAPEQEKNVEVITEDQEVIENNAEKDQELEKRDQTSEKKDQEPGKEDQTSEGKDQEPEKEEDQQHDEPFDLEAAKLEGVPIAVTKADIIADAVKKISELENKNNGGISNLGSEVDRKSVINRLNEVMNKNNKNTGSHDNDTREDGSHSQNSSSNRNDSEKNNPGER